MTLIWPEIADDTGEDLTPLGHLAVTVSAVRASLCTLAVPPGEGDTGA